MPGSQGGQGPGLDNLMPMMEGMMQSLLSKDLLYPAMKELAEKVCVRVLGNTTQALNKN